MKFVRETAPYIRKGSSVKRMMLDVIIALMPVTIFAIVINGLGAIYVLLISLITIILSELIFYGLVHKPSLEQGLSTFKEKFKYTYQNLKFSDLYPAIITSIIFSMIMPAARFSDSSDLLLYLFVIFISSLFGITIGKLLFGGLGSNIFNPAAVGRVFAGICFGTLIGKANTYDVLTSATPLTHLQDSLTNINQYKIADLFWGTQIGGTMGEVSVICILAGAIYLIVRRSADYRVMLSSLITFIILMLCAGFKLFGFNADAFKFMLYELLSGGFLFCISFMLTDPVTSPVTSPGRYLFGILASILIVLIRLIGAYPEGAAFSILIVNMLVPVIDYYKFQRTRFNYKIILFYALIIAIFGLIIVLAL